MKTDRKVIAIMQARMSSSRLPGKVLEQLGSRSLLEYELARLARARTIDMVVVATSENPEDDPIALLCEKIHVACVRGSLNDVLSRYVETVKKFPAHEVVVRITGDCPLIDPVVLDEAVSFFLKHEFDYVSNVPDGKETFPDGIDCEVFTRNILLRTGNEAKLVSEHEHVTPYIRNHPEFYKGSISAPEDYSAYRLTVDNQADLDVVRFVVQHSSLDASYIDYIKLLNEHPEIRSQNTHFTRNEGLAKSIAQDATINP